MLLYMYWIQRNLHPWVFFPWHYFPSMNVRRSNFSLNTTLSGKIKNRDNLRFVSLSENNIGQKNIPLHGSQS